MEKEFKLEVKCKKCGEKITITENVLKIQLNPKTPVCTGVKSLSFRHYGCLDDKELAKINLEESAAKIAKKYEEKKAAEELKNKESDLKKQTQKMFWNYIKKRYNLKFRYDSYWRQNKVNRIKKANNLSFKQLFFEGFYDKNIIQLLRKNQKIWGINQFFYDLAIVVNKIQENRLLKQRAAHKAAMKLKKERKYFTDYELGYACYPVEKGYTEALRASIAVAEAKRRQESDILKCIFG